MSKNDIYFETDLNSTSSYGNKLFNGNHPFLEEFSTPTRIGINHSYTQPKFSKLNTNNIINQKRSFINNNLIKPQMSYENTYIKDRYTKVKEENSQLKRKLFDLEKNYKIKKGQLEEQILILRDENTNLQLQIQKTIENYQNSYKSNDNIYMENKALLNEISLLKNDKNTLKDNITKKNAEIEEKSKIINDLFKEKNIFVKEETDLKNQINDLEKDKEILIKQIQDLNKIIGEKISPKLVENENNLFNLQKQIENLRINNEKFKSDNILLFNENKIQKNLIKILTAQNKKLLGEIKIIYDRDILLMDNFEKMGNNSTGEFKQFLDKNMVNNQKLFEEEINILKQSQQYLNDRDDYKENDLSFENEETKIIKDNSAIKNQVKMDIKINNIMNKNNRMKNSNINSKKNLKIEKENNINNKEVNGEIERSLYKNNNDFIDDINIKRTSQILSTNITTNEKMNYNDIKINEDEQIEKKLNLNSFRKNDNNYNRFQENNDDIKTNSELSVSHNEEYQFTTFDNNNNSKIDNKQIPFNIENRNYYTDLKNSQFISSDNNQNNNNLFMSQTKSLLSEYVEDLDVIK